MSSHDEEMQDAPVNGHVQENGVEEEVDEKQRIRVVCHKNIVRRDTEELMRNAAARVREHRCVFRVRE